MLECFHCIVELQVLERFIGFPHCYVHPARLVYVVAILKTPDFGYLQT